MSLRKITIGLAVAVAAMGALSIPASAQAGSSVLAAETFTGSGIGLKPPQARSMARSEAYADAASAGYSAIRCRAINSSLFFDGHFYEATLTISCS